MLALFALICFLSGIGISVAGLSGAWDHDPDLRGEMTRVSLSLTIAGWIILAILFVVSAATGNSCP